MADGPPWTEELIMAAVAGLNTEWSDHNGALKYYRDNLPLDTDHTLTTNNEWVKKRRPRRPPGVHLRRVGEVGLADHDRCIPR